MHCPSGRYSPSRQTLTPRPAPPFLHIPPDIGRPTCLSSQSCPPFFPHPISQHPSPPLTLFSPPPSSSQVHTPRHGPLPLLPPRRRPRCLPLPGRRLPRRRPAPRRSHPFPHPRSARRHFPPPAPFWWEATRRERSWRELKCRELSWRELQSSVTSSRRELRAELLPLARSGKPTCISEGGARRGGASRWRSARLSAPRVDNAVVRALL